MGSQHASGETMTINAGEEYLVVLHVQDPNGIKEMDLTGNGKATCSTAPGPGGQGFTSEFPLPVSIPSVTASIPSSGTTTGFVMSNSITYTMLNCGVHQYANMPAPADFTANSGNLVIQGTEIAWDGTTKNTATLTMTAQ